QAQRAAVLRVRLVRLAHTLVEHGTRAVHRRRLWVLLRGAIELLLGERELALIHVLHAELGVEDRRVLALGWMLRPGGSAAGEQRGECRAGEPAARAWQGGNVCRCVHG